jgi:hypothetical protein
MNMGFRTNSTHCTCVPFHLSGPISQVNGGNRTLTLVEPPGIRYLRRRGSLHKFAGHVSRDGKVDRYYGHVFEGGTCVDGYDVLSPGYPDYEETKKFIKA